MPRVLIAGCGYVGEAAANLFHESGWEVEGWTASVESAGKLSHRPYRVCAADVTDPKITGDFDVVIHCVSSQGGNEEEYRSLYFQGANNLLRAFPTATLLFTSSTSVYAQTDGSVVDESSPAEPRHAKGQILRETEDLVLGAGGIVLRLGGIHGPGRSFFLSRFLEGYAAASNDRLINQVHRDDIVSAVRLLAERRGELAGEIFNVVGDEPIKASDASAWLASRLKKSLPTTAGQARPSKRGQSNKRVSNRKLRALGWEPRYPTFEVAMSDSILPSFGF
ncbi:MAG TPA: NAD-dependent epimerase/dehydratase family protein [Chthoniobacterales bacterium]|jgi:nucleoside-diphosphate-sugar epimerase|nr:NAD-dependent epimerase/dehydratase family protein [Chthoniobacterales bacterium]